MIQESPRYCGECPDYAPSLTSGICDRLGDVAGPVFSVSYTRPDCIYDNSPDSRLSPQEIEDQKARQLQQQRDFHESLERTSREVESWPEWKRNMLGSMKASLLR